MTRVESEWWDATTSAWRRPTHAGTPPPPPPPSAMVIGARSKTALSRSQAELIDDFNRAQSLIGPLGTTRTYHATAPGNRYTKRISGADMLSMMALPTDDATLRGFLQSLNPGDRIIWHHEPEGPSDGYANGAAYTAEFTAVRNRIKNLVPDVAVGHAAGGYQYRSPAGRGWDGSFIPHDADFLYMDVYRDSWTSNPSDYGFAGPLSTTPNFQRWLTLVQAVIAEQAPRKIELGVAEWAIGTVGMSEVAGTSAARAALIPQDIAYLTGLGFARASYWFCDYGPDGRTWEPKDAASLAALTALPRRTA